MHRNNVIYTNPYLGSLEESLHLSPLAYRDLESQKEFDALHTRYEYDPTKALHVERVVIHKIQKPGALFPLISSAFNKINNKIHDVTDDAADIIYTFAHNFFYDKKDIKELPDIKEIKKPEVTTMKLTLDKLF